ncbi:MAG: hypothetical protein ACYS0D_04590 [Planctomycetota bacterium]|jgi:hypothetical protein
MPPLAHLLAIVAVTALLGAGEANSEPPAEARPTPAEGSLDRARSAPSDPIVLQESRPLGAPSAPEMALGEAGPERVRRTSGIGELGRVTAALAAVLGLLYLVRALLRRAGVGGPLGGGGRPGGVLGVLARYPIARGQQLVLLKLGSRVVLLHQSRAGLTPISEVVEPDEVAALLGRIEGDGREVTSGRFTAMLERFGETSRGEGLQRTFDGEGNEVIDLTRRARGGSWLGGLLGRGGSP